MKNIFIYLFAFIFISIISNGQSIHLALSVNSLTLSPGQSQSVGITITPGSGFNQQVFLAGINQCNNLTIQFPIDPVIYPYSGASVTITALPSAIQASCVIEIIGYNGPVSDTEFISVLINATNCSFGLLNTMFQTCENILANQNGVWMGGTSLFKHTDSTLSSFPLSGRSQDLAEDSHHNIWIATQNGILKFDGTFWSVFNSSNSGFPTEVFGSIAIDSSDNVWVTTADDNVPNDTYGIFKYDGVQWIQFDTLTSQMPSNKFRKITFDRNGLLWVFGFSYATNKYEIYNYDGTNWILKNFPDSCIDIGSPCKIRFDSYNNAWFGNQYGLIKYDGLSAEIWEDSAQHAFNHFKFDMNCTLLLEDSASKIPGPVVHNVFIDNSDNVWIAPYEAGLVMFDGNTFTDFNRTNSTLHNNAIWDIDQLNDSIYLLTSANYTTGITYLEYYTCLTVNGIFPAVPSGISISPNPNSGDFFLRVPENRSPFQIRIFDSTGKLVFESTLRESMSFHLNLRDGIYLVQMQNGDSNYIERIIIQN